jgi:hypothetical protein
MKKINAINDAKERRKANKVAYDITAKKGKKSDRAKHVRELTEYCNDKLYSEWRQSERYSIYRKSDFEFYVKRNYDLHPPKLNEDLEMDIATCERLLQTCTEEMEETKDKTEIKTIRDILDKLLGVKSPKALPEYSTLLHYVCCDVIPRFENTRTVNVHPRAEGGYVITCNCGRWTKFKRACRCMYKLVKRLPCLQDAHVRWHLGYAHFYNRDEEMTKYYLMLRDEVDMPGMPISETEWDSLQEQLKVGEGERPLSYFLRSLNRLHLIGDNSFWHRCLKNDRAPKELVNELKSACDIIDHSAPVENDAEDNESFDVTFSPISRSPACRRNLNLGFFSQEDTNVGLSNYTVPTQTQNDETPQRSGKRPRRNAYQEFLHFYEEMTKLTDANGEEGMEAFREDMNRAWTRQYEIQSKRNPIKNSGTSENFVSFPQTSTKRKAVRMKKITSPRK